MDGWYFAPDTEETREAEAAMARTAYAAAVADGRVAA